MREKILERETRQKITHATRRKINQRLGQLKRKYSDKWDIDYFWNEAGDKLVVKAQGTCWETVFSRAKLTVYLDAPIHLKIFLSPFREKFEKEIDRALSTVSGEKRKDQNRIAG